ncbi:hypothetical protein [Paenibacillus oryzisoli]|uniref:Uncharacterized protein n=1 Tax=Paenibacillus oryzisoli TaxID=1850517 RepID=A0A197ZW77_9BACL|nr:hypothetical protein [Paenibacillus oryzisoli]OAS13285.1 hypothetical protein A8708_10840 [Paenibacillus oryzisoli]
MNSERSFTTPCHDDILERGKEEWANAVVRAKTGPKDREIKSKAANLGERLMMHNESILRILRDTVILIDNNQPE